MSPLLFEQGVRLSVIWLASTDKTNGLFLGLSGI